jgi:hypothetical protein
VPAVPCAPARTDISSWCSRANPIAAAASAAEAQRAITDGRRSIWAFHTRGRLPVSPRLRDDFGNGDQFYARAGKVIDLPEHRADRPNRDFLEWHLGEVFKAS